MKVLTAQVRHIYNLNKLWTPYGPYTPYLFGVPLSEVFDASHSILSS